MHPQYQPWLHRFAVFTATVALLLPITVGALVTTLDAGMAFKDWPSSDGHNMVLYPWLKSVGDKFVEHGHRLAGMAIGLISIVFAATVWRYESRRWVQAMGVGVLLAVIFQGWLGGQRVQLDARGLAMLHGLFASWVFALMSSMAVVTSKSWFESANYKTDEWSLSTGISAVVTLVVILLQFVLGGLLRHHGRVVYEHAGFACLVLLSVMWLWVGAYGSGIAWLRRNATLLIVAVLAQIMLGVVTFVAKFGTGMGDSVVVQGSLLQDSSRTGHTVLGMLVWMLAVVYLVRVIRIMWVRHHQPGFGFDTSLCGQGLMTGGAP